MFVSVQEKAGVIPAFFVLVDFTDIYYGKPFI